MINMFFFREDANDVDEFGMDSHTRRRLRLRDKGPTKVKKNAVAHHKNRVPHSLMNIRNDTGRMESVRDAVAWLSEVVEFVTPGREKKGKFDAPGYVLSHFFHSTPEFEASLVEKIPRRGGWIVRGAWPSSGRHVFDWEFDVTGDRGGQVTVKFTMWGQDGIIDGHTFTTTAAVVPKLAKKFVRKYFIPMKVEAKEQAK